MPNEVPIARVVTFGYNSAWAFSKSVMGINDFADDLLDRLKSIRRTNTEAHRPILFICHSLGGIVVKSAMARAYEKQYTFGTLISGIRGIIFMGTPHAGSGVATVAKVAGTIVNMLVPCQKIRSSLLHTLSTNSKELEDINRTFCHRFGHLKVASFIEGEIFPGLKSTVGLLLHIKDSLLTRIRLYLENLHCCIFHGRLHIIYKRIIRPW